MSKFLTPPVWYDKNGNVNKMLNGVIFSGNGGIPIGEEASVGGRNGIAIGQKASTISPNGIAIGGGANVSSGNGIAIGGTVGLSSDNGIAIGQGANVSTQNTIQLGNNDTTYTLNVGDGDSTINGYIKGIAVPVGNAGFKSVTYITEGVYTQENVYGGMYVVRVEGSSETYRTQCSFLFDIYTAGGRPIYSPLFKWNTKNGGEFAAVVATQVPDLTGVFTLGVFRNVMSAGPVNVVQDVNISVHRISQSYPVG